MTLRELRALVPDTGHRGVSKEIAEFNAAIARPEFMHVTSYGIDALLERVEAFETVTGARAHYKGFAHKRASYSYATVTTLAEYQSAIDQLPRGYVLNANRTPSDKRQALDNEVAVKLDARTYQRYMFDRSAGLVWQPCGLSVKLQHVIVDYYTGKERSEWYWEHGATKEACIAERDRKDAIARMEYVERAKNARQKARDDRRARLVARLCHSVQVSAEDVHAVGACTAGIEAWCTAHGISPAATLPLPELARDSRAAVYALKLARKVTRVRA